MTKNNTAFDRAPLRQKIAFWLALTDLMAVAGWTAVRIYFAVIGDTEGDRKFVLNPIVLQVFPVVVLIWIVGFLLVASSLVESRRATSPGLWALILLLIPALPVIRAVAQAYWNFFMTL